LSGKHLNFIFVLIMTNTAKHLCETIGHNIKKLRKKKKVGQVELANRIYLSRSSLSNIEIGNQQPTLQAIYEIAIALKCDITEILPTKVQYQSITDNIDPKMVQLLNESTNIENTKTLNVLKEILSKDE